ncbi:helix-turn-helix domain-containing protein [Roseovarius aestuariivivens]|uniref:helix-turn-helix domain-containing protein n=1 Tax=Roseovarius aestuariivivens TaxID=1888910 RepID=UPI0010814FD7|nr:helix-turn-helix domain-containing protein [Roseovarius aestuariivivens]
MYLDSFDPARVAPAAPLQARRSLSGEFLFISQDDSVGFTAEACIHVLRSANRLLERDSYGWTHLTERELERCEGSLCGPDQTLVLIGGTERAWLPRGTHLRLLRSAIRSARRVCVVGAAVFVPMAAGVLSAKRLAVHPVFQPAVAEAGGGVDLHPGATCHHKALSSATGPAAAMRMMVELVGARDGDFTSTTLARDLGLTDPEETCGTGEHWRFQRMAQGDEVIGQALQIMEDHLEDTLSVAQVAGLLGISPRKLERCFSDRLGRSPLKVYRDLRLDRAYRLLAQTALPLGEVSVACGFSNVTLMKRWFHQKYGQMPQDIRQHAFAGGQSA